jgi:hypothetical protein
MVDSADYPFVEGNRILERNTYFYVDCSDERVLRAWLRTREETINWCGGAVEPSPSLIGPMSQDPDTGSFDTKSLLTHLLNEQTDKDTLFYTLKLLRRFEVTKRIHAHYDPSFRAIDKKDFKSPENYLLFAQLCIRVYEAHGYLQLLNALLKAADTLISVRTQLREEQKQNLAWILSKEVAFVNELSDRSRGAT